MKSFNQKKFYRSTFRVVLSHYERKRARSSSGSVKLDSGSSGGPRNSKVCFPSDSDFCCDVEIAGKAVLRGGDFAFFKGYYLDGIEEVAERMKRKVDKDSYKEYTRIIQEKVGREFLARRIYPVSEYMHSPSGVVGNKKCKCKDVTHTAGKNSHVWCQCGCGLNMSHHEPAYWEVDATSFKLWCSKPSEDESWVNEYI